MMTRTLQIKQHTSDTRFWFYEAAGPLELDFLGLVMICSWQTAYRHETAESPVHFRATFFHLGYEKLRQYNVM